MSEDLTARLDARTPDISQVVAVQDSDHTSGSSQA